MRLRLLLAWLAVSAVIPRLEAQEPARERQPKTPIELEREAERVRTRDLAEERYSLPPLTTRALRKAVEKVVSGEPADGRITARWAEMLTAEGRYFVPLQLTGSNELGFVSGQKAVAFGAVYGPDDQEVLSFELERDLGISGTHVFVDLPLPLEAGEYRGVMGLAAGKEPRGVVRLNLSPQPIAKDSFTVSRLLLAENLFMLPRAQEPDEAFAFGGIKVVLRGEPRFVASEQPWVFLVFRQPGLATDGQPKLTVRLILEGPEGPVSKTRTIPVADPAPTSLKGFPGQFALGLPLELTRHTPGRYEIRLELEDSIRQESRHVSASFEVIP